MSWTPRLRTVLLLVNVIILAMPLAAIGALRIYDSELIRQTEAELIAQGAFVQATFAQALRQRLIEANVEATVVGVTPTTTLPLIDDQFIPLTPHLDASSDSVLPPGPMPTPTDRLPHPEVASAGGALHPILTQAQRITLAGIRVVDVNGTIIASTAGEFGVSILDFTEVQRALRGEFVTLLRRRESSSPQPALDSISRGNHVRVFVAMPVLVDEQVVGAVVLSRTPISISEALYRRRHVFGGALAVLLLGVLLITTLTAVTIQRPLRALVRQTRKLAANPSDAVPLASPGTTEFAELSEAFVTMARTLDAREQYLSTFARNVSHELKTPLTSMRGSIELLQDHIDEMSVEERDQLLTVLDDECSRLNALVADLLHLARADVYRPDDARCDVRAVVQRCANDLDFDVLVGGADVAVNMSAEALALVVSNFIANAKTHGATRVTVELRSEVTAVITVSDDGPGIDASVAHSIFDEFFTTARDRGGTGLGLSIVRAIVRAHGGEVELVDPASAAFVVRVPLAK